MTAESKLRAAVAEASDGSDSRRKILTLIVTCAVIFLDSLDTSTVGVALPSIQSDLGLSASSLQWLVSGYVIAYGGFLLLGGRVADLLGRRRVFFIGTAVFVAASVLGGAVSSEELIVASRVIKGISAAFTAPAAFSIITTTFREGPERNKALSVYGATAAVGYSVGLIASGLLTSVSWRLVFFVPGVLAVGVLLMTPAAVRRDVPADRTGRSFDFGGAILATSALLLLVYALVQAPLIGWLAPATLISLALAVVLFSAFLIIESRHHDPTLPLGILRSRGRASCYVVALLHGAAAIGWQFVAVLYLQQILGYGPFLTSLAVLPIGVTIYLTAQFLTSRLIGRFGIRVVCIAGMTIQAVAVGMYALVGLEDSYATLVLPGLILHGLACGVVFSSVNVGGVAGVADHQQGVAASLIVAAYAIGTGVGVAVMATIISARAATDAPADLLGAYQAAFVVAALLALLGAAFSVFGLPAERRAPAAPEAVPAS
ncbi:MULTISPECIES: MFS transporter [Catenuloplanes]|uniref:MFS family permease n=1 Tax=Catenuloplanes niger TaxID=587534 RepID=A0AAE4CXK4_9ACTN|nr:MFS transporter [Catenuloplanes niger]MDR7327582.1 MFS family permease [Catenuloplanes niger]